MAKLSPTVRIVEVGPRDGLQNIYKTLPTKLKIKLIERLAATGLQVIEATSFVSPNWIPQLADGGEVMQAIKPLMDLRPVRYPVLVPNVKGFEAARRAGAKEVGVFVSATEGFSQKNQNCSVADALARARGVAEQAIPLGIPVRGYASCIFSCPYDGPTDPTEVLKVTQALLDMGCFEVSLGDTLGVGTPAQVRQLLDVLLKVVPASRLAGHFHDTYGQAVANAVTAFDLGLRVFDSSVAGLGGCPYSPGARGNLASEDVVYAFEKMGVSTGVDLEKLVEVGDWISNQIGQVNGSRAGTAIHAKRHDLHQKPPNKKSQSEVKSAWTLIQDAQEYQVLRSGQSIKVVLSRPRNGNALTVNMLQSLAELFERLAHDNSVSRIVLTAEGKFFCTGMDLSAGGATKGGATAEAKDAQFNGLLRLFEAIDNAPQTTIAVVNGSCYGGGVGLAFCCDIRLALADARFTTTEVKLGLCPATISKYLVREWGFSFAREAILTARPVTPKELHDKVATIHGIAKDAAGLETLLEDYLTQLKKAAPQASAKSKDLIRAAYEHAGAPKQAGIIKDVFEWMMQPPDEARYGTEQFRAGKRDIDWDEFVARKGRAKL